MKNDAPIWFFDSGIGWKTTLEETRKLLPNENYVYFADSRNNPYWDKSDEDIFLLVEDWVDFLIKKWCKIIILACNTATSICIYKIRNIYKDIPIIWAVPALKVAIDKHKNQNILVMATPATINSEKFLHFYYTYYNPNISLLPCPNLANLIENNKENEIDEYLQNILKDYKNTDTVVLGCTHYIYIKENIRKYLPSVEFVDWNEWIARQTKKVLEEKWLLNQKENKGDVVFYNS